jgi:hypothetical protein
MAFISNDIDEIDVHFGLPLTNTANQQRQYFKKGK